MKVLTVQQPAAGAIVTLGKDVENRTWGTSYRGPVAIQAGAKAMPAGHPFWRFEPYLVAQRNAERAQLEVLHVVGAIIAVVDLVDVHMGRPGCCESPWGEGNPWPVHWVLANVRELELPYLWKGALGLRDLPASVEAAVLRGIA